MKCGLIARRQEGLRAAYWTETIGADVLIINKINTLTVVDDRPHEGPIALKQARILVLRKSRPAEGRVLGYKERRQPISRSPEQMDVIAACYAA